VQKSKLRQTVEKIFTNNGFRNAVRMGKKQELNQLLVIGPPPPPVAGISVSFKLFCDFLETQSNIVSVKTLNTAPKQLGSIPLLSFRNRATANRVLWGCLLHVRNSNNVLLFGSNQFLKAIQVCLLRP